MVKNDPFSEGVTPLGLITALDDAREEMNYSNFHADKFERIEKIIRRYCRERGIPVKRRPLHKNGERT